MASPADETLPEAALPATLRRQIERWFVRRGVPQFIEGYSSEQRMDARARPWIAAWILLGTVLFWSTRPDWHPAWNLAGVIGTLLFVALAYAAIGRLRGRRLGARPQKYDLVDIGLFGVLPALPTAAIHASVTAAVWTTLNALLGIGIIYIVIAFGLFEIALWAVGRLQAQITQIVPLLATTLPVLLILVVFLLFSAEIWEAAHRMHAGELAAVLLLLIAIAALLIVTTFGPEVRRLQAREDWEAILVEAGETPAAPLIDRLHGPMPQVPGLTWLQRTNVGFLVLINQLLQSSFVALLVMAFLVVFGVLALPASVQEVWIGEPVTILISFDTLGEVRTVSAKLLTVTAMLSGIVGLYFTGLSLTDVAYRAEHFARTIDEVRHLLSARAVYLSALRGPGAT